MITFQRFGKASFIANIGLDEEGGVGFAFWFFVYKAGVLTNLSN
jgi:hypothetical protein